MTLLPNLGKGVEGKPPLELGREYHIRLVGRHIWHHGVVEKAMVMTRCGAWIKIGHVGNYNLSSIPIPPGLRKCRSCYR